MTHNRPALIRDAQNGLEEEQRLKEVSRDQLLASERKAHSLQNALEEARTLLEQSDRSRRLGEQELCDTNEQLSELTCVIFFAFLYLMYSSLSLSLSLFLSTSSFYSNILLYQRM